jgi:hypothetical protein
VRLARVFQRIWCADAWLFARRVVQELGAKTRVMELMSHGNPDVRYQALVAVQQLVSHPWQAV